MFKVSTRELEHECRGSTVGFGIGIPITLVVGIVLGLLLGRLRQGKENRVAADDALQVFVEYILQIGESFS